MWPIIMEESTLPARMENFGSHNLKADGTLDTENLIEPLAMGIQSTSTPAIYNNRIYVGTNAGSMFGVEGNAIVVVDIDPVTGAMTPAYAVPQMDIARHPA